MFVLGTVTVVASSQFAPERIYPYLQAASAAIVLSLGAWLIVRAILGRRHMAHADDHHPHDHTDHVHTHPDHGHDNGHHPHDEHGQQHPHPHDEDHDRGADTSGGRWHTHGLLPHRHGSALRELDPGAGPLSGRSLLVLGLSGGLVPSTSAVLLLLGAIQLERLFMGGLLILGFGVGMAVALVGTGVGIVALSRRAERRFDAHAWAQRLAANLQPIAGVVMLGVGGYLITRAFATIAG